MVQRRWPEWTGWTDHNVSDPGVTLIETFAYMVEQLIFRLNRVPDKNYVKFLELIGIELRPPHAADRRRDVLAHGAPAAGRRRLPVGSEVATERTDISDAIVFRTSEALDIVPCHRAAAASAAGRSRATRTRPTRWPSAARSPSSRTSRPPATPSTSACRTPRRRAWWPSGSPATSRATASTRSTRPASGRRGRRRGGRSARSSGTTPVASTAPATSSSTSLAATPSRPSPVGPPGWLRCVITVPAEGQPMYRATPRVRGLEAFTIGGTATAVHAERDHQRGARHLRGRAGAVVRPRAPPRHLRLRARAASR